MVIMYVLGQGEPVRENIRAKGAGWIVVRWKVLRDYVSEDLAAAFHNFVTLTTLVGSVAMFIQYLLNTGHHISFVSSRVFAILCHHALTRSFIAVSPC